MLLNWSTLWIATYALVTTPIYWFCFFSSGWFKRQTMQLRWIFANLMATLVGLAFGYFDFSPPRSPPEAYEIALAQCVLVVVALGVFGWASNRKALNPARD